MRITASEATALTTSADRRGISIVHVHTRTHPHDDNISASIRQSAQLMSNCTHLFQSACWSCEADKASIRETLLYDGFTVVRDSSVDRVVSNTLRTINSLSDLAVWYTRTPLLVSWPPPTNSSLSYHLSAQV